MAAGREEDDCFAASSVEYYVGQASGVQPFAKSPGSLLDWTKFGQ